MSGFLVIGLIVVVWLVVLAPLLLRGQKPIVKAGEAFDDTRVISEGGSNIPAPRRLGVSPDHADEDEESDELVDDYEIVDSPSIFRPRKEERFEEDLDADMEMDDDIEVSLEDEEYVEPAPVVEVSQEWNVEEHYDLDDAHTTPLDQLHPAARARAYEDYRSEEQAQPVAEEYESDSELTEEDVAFAARRRGRGYYDPEADREFAASQYIRRQRTLLGLVAAVVITVILGFVFGGGVWALTAIAAASTVVYLMALRSQVRAENELRARRIRRLRRSRMGVRSPEDLPSRLRRPGAVVLEIDDESPDFEGLATVSLAEETHYQEPGRNVRHLGQRRVS
ncbi:gephyrin-like molybdotransferase receptor GlpR [Corynebacterium crudilactis]|uniref:DUF3329 domain-containing protein n=1 Tax=Corynebacterium crudilactis TaxID=1652495 RepID=A0A172QS62_9CORY|nr:gephyrin-like molybdotransferase receptor GlpR [Corynebacterium crudilactis]ANE03525.1 hypothetical protein ccrud_04370 [Corynebacterium crudilactis]